MAIRFQCAGCGEPIEIDDQWASKPVVCPYCRKTITAPSESTLQDIAEIPTARPMPGVVQPGEVGAYSPGAGMSVSGAPPLMATTGQPANTVALVSLVLGSVAMLFFIISVTLNMVYSDQMLALMDRAEEVGQMAATSELLAKSGSMPGWLVASSILAMGLLISAMAAVVCGAFGLRRVRRRSYAIAGLVAGGIVLLITCGGSVLSLAFIAWAG